MIRKALRSAKSSKFLSGQWEYPSLPPASVSLTAGMVKPKC